MPFRKTPHRTIAIASSGLILALGLAPTHAAEAPSLEVLWQRLQQQQQQIDRLQAENQQLQQRLEVTGDRVEQVAERSSAAPAHEPRTHLGGYGELHYNAWENQRATGSDKDELDFHRFVLFFGHRFDERLRFQSELEIEHALAGDGAPGEVELEQAYIEADLSDRHRAKAGLFLLPVGILNETHEPTTFYGTERNPVEKHIIPTTWWEAGVGANGELMPGLAYDASLHSGLKTSAADGYAIRDGRQKAAKADAEDLAATARLKWTGAPGLELAASVQYQQDVTQGADPAAGSATLLEAHAVWNRGPFGLRTLYAQWDLEGDGPAALGADEQSGWYLEPSWKITPRLGVFGRYSVWDNAAGDHTDSEYNQLDIGLNYWPHPDVVLKADYQNQDSPDGADEFDGFNLGIGYQF